MYNDKSWEPYMSNAGLFVMMSCWSIVILSCFNLLYVDPMVWTQ